MANFRVQKKNPIPDFYQSTVDIELFGSNILSWEKVMTKVPSLDHLTDTTYLLKRPYDK